MGPTGPAAALRHELPAATDAQAARDCPADITGTAPQLESLIFNSTSGARGPRRHHSLPIDTALTPAGHRREPLTYLSSVLLQPNQDGALLAVCPSRTT